MEWNKIRKGNSSFLLWPSLFLCFFIFFCFSESERERERESFRCGEIWWFCDSDVTALIKHGASNYNATTWETSAKEINQQKVKREEQRIKRERERERERETERNLFFFLFFFFFLYFFKRERKRVVEWSRKRNLPLWLFSTQRQLKTSLEPSQCLSLRQPPPGVKSAPVSIGPRVTVSIDWISLTTIPSLLPPSAGRDDPTDNSPRPSFSFIFIWLIDLYLFSRLK